MSGALRVEYGGSVLSLEPGEKAHIACDAGTAETLLSRILTESGETTEATAFCRAEPALLADLPVWENAALPLALRGHSLHRVKPVVVEVLRALEVGHAARALPGRLTDFERRQVALVRGLIRGPGLLVLDHIAEGLNAVESRRLYELLMRQSAYQSAAALFLGGSPPEWISRRYTFSEGLLQEADR